MVQTKRYAGLTAANTKKVAMAAPMFFIIIPTLNVAAVLPACLDSIARQTCGDFELVLVDGGSTDETLDIANIFAPNLGERLIIHRDTDQGVYDAMNRGVDLATGTWLLFLGADDSLYEADTLARVAAFIGEHEPSDLVYGDVIMRSTNFRWGGAFDLDRLLFKRNICHQAIFYRRGLFGTIGPYNLRYRVLADWDFNIRCFSNPALVTRYMHVVVASYNEFGGLSNTIVDKEFLKRLPMSTRLGIRLVITAEGRINNRPVCRQRVPPSRRFYVGRPQDGSEISMVGRQVVCRHQLGYVGIQGVVTVGENAAQIPAQTRQPVLPAEPVERETIEGKDQRTVQAVQDADRPDPEEAGPRHVWQRKPTAGLRTPVGVRDGDVRNAG